MTATYSNNTALKILDLKTVTSTLVVTGGTSFIYDVDVRINISHTNDADLQVIAGFFRRYQRLAGTAYPLAVPPVDHSVSKDDWRNVGASLMESLRDGKVHPAPP